jgi:predicted metal-dependent HD superfamily phosphohydrolase
MGDRFDRRRPGLGERLMQRRGVPPPTILAWGLEGGAARIGHNNGPPLDDDSPGYVWRRHRWKTVHAEVWRTPPLPILKFRLRRAEAAGLDYRSYMLTLLDTGRCAQARDDDAERATAMATIRAAWNGLMSRLAPAASRIDRGIWLDSLVSAYDAPERRHHDVRHIAAMLDDLDRYGETLADRDTVALAILFHDCVYEPKRKDNEAESASRARLILGSLGVTTPLIERVAALVLATAHLAATDAPFDDPATTLLLDLDLAILAALPSRYAAYAADIRAEYGHLPDADFRAGRARVLTHFLDQPRIYRTPALAALWETRARTNLASERARLEPPSAG